MGWKKSAAEKLDNAAAALYRTGKKAGGEKGGRAGDAVASTVIGEIRTMVPSIEYPSLFARRMMSSA